MFENIIHTIERIKSEDFLKEASYNITIIELEGRKTIQKESFVSRKIYDLKIIIEIEKNNILSFKHVLTDSFLEEFIPIWEKEIKNREIDTSIKKIRKNLLRDYSTIQITEVKKENIELIIKSLLVFQIITKYIFKNGKLPRAMWYSKDPDYIQWKKYFSLKPIIAGLIDGLIDEITGINMAILNLYEIAFDKKIETQIEINFLKTERNKGLIELYRNEENMDNDDSEHKAGMALISVSTMLSDNVKKLIEI